MGRVIIALSVVSGEGYVGLCFELLTRHDTFSRITPPVHHTPRICLSHRVMVVVVLQAIATTTFTTLPPHCNHTVFFKRATAKKGTPGTLVAKTGWRVITRSKHATLLLVNAHPDLPLAAVHTGPTVSDDGYSLLKKYLIVSPPPEYGRATRPRLDQEPTRNAARSRVGGAGAGRVDSRYSVGRRNIRPDFAA